MPLRKAGVCPEPEPECCLPAPAQGMRSGSACYGLLCLELDTARQLVKAFTLFEQLERLRLQQHMQQPCFDACAIEDKLRPTSRGSLPTAAACCLPILSRNT